MGPNLLCTRVVVTAVIPGISLPMFSDSRRPAPRRSPSRQSHGAALRSRGKNFWLRSEHAVGASRERVGCRTLCRCLESWSLPSNRSVVDPPWDGGFISVAPSAGSSHLAETAQMATAHKPQGKRPWPARLPAPGRLFDPARLDAVLSLSACRPWDKRARDAEAAVRPARPTQDC